MLINPITPNQNSSESTRLRIGESLPNQYEDHIAGKGAYSLHHYNLVHKFPMHQAMKIPAAKAAVDKEWEKLEKISAWNLTKVRSKKDVTDEARTKGVKVHFASLMDICHLKNANWRQITKNTKVELYSEVILWKMIQDLMQYSLNKDLQHLTWQPPKSWISSPDCRVAQDKQLTQHLLMPRSKWKMLQNYWKFPIRNVQTFGFVYHDTNGQNHCPVWKTQSFLLSEICTVILWQDCYGKRNLRKSYYNTVGKRFPIGNAYSYTLKNGYSYRCMWMTSNWLERNKILIRCGTYSIKMSIWESQHLSLIMYTWAALKDNVK